MKTTNYKIDKLNSNSALIISIIVPLLITIELNFYFKSFILLLFILFICIILVFRLLSKKEEVCACFCGKCLIS